MKRPTPDCPACGHQLTRTLPESGSKEDRYTCTYPTCPDFGVYFDQKGEKL